MRRLTELFTEGPLARLLREEDDSLAHESGASGDSLDSQVDRYLGQYETDSKKSDGAGPEASVDQMEALDWRDLVKGHLILEAGDDDAPPDPGDAAPGAAAMTGDDTTKPGLDSIDVEKFGNDVVRLIQNYDSLLEIRSTLIRRAKSFLAKTYSDDVLDAFESTLRDDHGMEAGEGSSDVAADKFKAPPADRAQGSAEPGGPAGPA
jgi:hypothetical protein